MVKYRGVLVIMVLFAVPTVLTLTASTSCNVPFETPQNILYKDYIAPPSFQ